MKVKLKDIISSATPTQEDEKNHIEAKPSQLQELLATKFPVKVSYRLSRLANKLEPILKSYEENRQTLVKEFGDKQPDDTFAVTNPKKLKTFFTKLEELQAVEEDIDFDKISIDELGNVLIEPNLLVNFIFE